MLTDSVDKCIQHFASRSLGTFAFCSDSVNQFGFVHCLFFQRVNERIQDATERPMYQGVWIVSSQNI